MDLRDVNNKGEPRPPELLPGIVEIRKGAITIAQMVMTMSQTQQASFTALDLGSAKPTSVEMQEVEILINGDLFGQYAKAFVDEGYRVNPLRAEQVKLTEKEVESYIYYLLTKRIECINQTCVDFRKLKSLYVPAWIQYNLSMIGIVTMRDIGLRMIPILETNSPLTYEQACEISEKIGYFIDDLQIVQDAMPRSIEGDRDVMSTALVANFVRSLSPVQHVASTYVTAFMGMRLKEEMAMSILYRVQYDDVNFIAAALTRQRGLY